jgi:hypothetical protein
MHVMAAVTALLSATIHALRAHRIRRFNRRIDDDLRDNQKHVFRSEVTGKEETAVDFRLLAGDHVLQCWRQDYLEAKVGHACEIHLAPKSRVVLQWRLLGD